VWAGPAWKNCSLIIATTCACATTRFGTRTPKKNLGLTPLGGDCPRSQFAEFTRDKRSARAVLRLAQALRQQFGIIRVVLKEKVPKCVANDLAVVLINPGFDLLFHKFLKLLAERYIHNATELSFIIK
jgi:hypothetical protein